MFYLQAYERFKKMQQQNIDKNGLSVFSIALTNILKNG